MNYQVSPGGVGSCALEDFFGGAINHPRSSWNAHERDPSKLPEGAKATYVFGDPYNIILSYFRRGFLKYPYTHATHMGITSPVLLAKQEWSIEDFLNLKEDPFKLEEHFLNWMYSGRNLMMIRYESLPRTINYLCSWYGLPFEYGNSFKFIPRASDFDKLDAELKKKMRRLYGGFKEMMEEMPDVSIYSN